MFELNNNEKIIYTCPKTGLMVIEWAKSRWYLVEYNDSEIHNFIAEAYCLPRCTPQKWLEDKIKHKLKAVSDWKQRTEIRLTEITKEQERLQKYSDLIGE